MELVTDPLNREQGSILSLPLCGILEEEETLRVLKRMLIQDGMLWV